jgi:hypothetical protein
MKCADSKVSGSFYEVRCRSAVEDAGTLRPSAHGATQKKRNLLVIQITNLLLPG